LDRKPVIENWRDGEVTESSYREVKMNAQLRFVVVLSPGGGKSITAQIA
jgi:hypothetical protein